MTKTNKLFKLKIERPRNVKNDILSGLTVALVLVPEALAFSFVARVDPIIGLYAAFMMGMITAIFGGASGDDFGSHRCGCCHFCTLNDRVVWQRFI